MKDPVGENTSTRWLNESLTITFPDGPTPMPSGPPIPFGRRSCPASVPSAPNARTKAPASLNSTTRLLAESTTNTLPESSSATPRGLLSSPEPNVRTNAPASVKTETRSLKKSLATTWPDPSTAMPHGLNSSPSPVPVDPPEQLVVHTCGPEPPATPPPNARTNPPLDE